MRPLALISASFLVAFSLLSSGCKEPPPPPRPTPTPTPTPEPLSDVIAFTEAGGLHTVAWKGDSRKTLYSDRKNSIWFPSAANKEAQAQEGPDGLKGPHFLAWLSAPDGTQNIVRIYLDGQVTQLTQTGERARPEMKNLRLGNSPLYSHDGKRIAYSHNGNIWIMDADGYNAVTVIADGNSWSPSWSVDDKRLVYVNIFEDRSDIWVTNLEDKDTYQVTDFEGSDVGQPLFTPEGKHIVLTRIQKDDSDVVMVISDPEQPLADAEPITRDRQSSNAIFSPDGIRIAYVSGPDDPFKPGDAKTAELNKGIDALTWYVWRAMPDGKKPERLGEARGMSPAWLRPDLPTPTETPKADKVLAAAPKETATSAQAQTTPSPAASNKPPRPDKPEPANQAARPTAVPTQRTQAPPPPQRPTPVPRTPAKPVEKAPIMQAAALKLRVSISFDAASDEITLGSLGSVQKVAGRASQYPAELIRIYGPLDTSPLKGAYPSQEARSKARADKVAAIIAQDKGVSASQLKTVPYIPAGMGAKPLTNGVQIYINVK